MPDQDHADDTPVSNVALDPALARLLDEAVPLPVLTPPTVAEVDAALLAVRARRDDPRAVSPVTSLNMYRSAWRGARMRSAAAVLVVAGAGLVWRMMADEGAPEGAAPMSRHATAAGTVDSIGLADGSQVLLGPGSTLTVSSGFGTSSREVTLTGDARFDVVHDQARPFVVHTAAASFRDVGTVFVVHGTPRGARIAVTEGAVAMVAAGAADSVLLRAGDRASVAGGGSVSVERAAASPEDVAWTSGRLVLRDETVAKAVAGLRRWYGMELRVDSALARLKVTATFERGMAPVDVAQVMATVLGGEVLKEGGTYRVVAPSGVTPAR